MLIYSNKHDLDNPKQREDLLDELNITDKVKSDKNLNAIIHLQDC